MAKATIFPFNLNKVLDDIPKPMSELTAPKANEVKVDFCTQDLAPQTPVTPASAEAVTLLL